jgi:hypothetical protein
MNEMTKLTRTKKLALKVETIRPLEANQLLAVQ